MKFNRQKFYDQFRAWRGHITKAQVRGLDFLLDCIEKDLHVKRLEWAAYMLATVKLETADTYLPIHEYGGKNYFVARYGGQTRKGRELGNDSPEEGFDYAGKGFVQLTGEYNYEKMEEALRLEYPGLIRAWENETGKKFDLTVGDGPGDKSDPQNAMHPRIAYAIMSYGMRNGSFTGHSLKRYTSLDGFDWVNARRIINGTDKAQTIAEYGKMFYKILSRALEREVTPENVGAAIDANRQEPVRAAPITASSPPAANTLEESEAQNTSPETSADTGPAPPPSSASTQTAENIVNVNEGAPVPPNFVEEKKVVEAPPPSGMMQRAWLWITGLGVGVPSFAGIVETIKSYAADDKLNVREIFAIIATVAKFIFPYLILILVIFLVGWILKELFKQATMLFEMHLKSRHDRHDVKVVPEGSYTANLDMQEFLKWKESQKIDKKETQR